MRIWVFLTFLLSVNFGQIIYHQPVHTARPGNDLSIEAIIDEGGMDTIGLNSNLRVIEKCLLSKIPSSKELGSALITYTIGVFFLII